jgi:hypothetical protein
MLKIDRMEFPKKYPIPNWLKILVLALVFASLMMYNCSQDKLRQMLKLSDIRISAFSKAQVEVEYTIRNDTKSDRDAWLLLKVFDVNDSLLASSLFLVKLKAGEKKDMLKVMDKLSRPLAAGEKPGTATLELYRRKGLL